MRVSAVHLFVASLLAPSNSAFVRPAKWHNDGEKPVEEDLRKSNGYSWSNVAATTVEEDVFRTVEDMKVGRGGAAGLPIHTSRHAKKGEGI
jgi:hypothetical protein